MKRSLQLFLSVLGCVVLSSSFAASGLPSCTDGRAQQGTKRSIENSYLRAGFSAGHAKFFIEKLNSLVELQDEVLTRNIVQEWRLRSPRDLRICRAELYPNAYMMTFIARNPAAANDIGYAVSNIGIPDAALVGEGWLRD